MEWMEANCFSMESPPSTQQNRSPVNRPSSLANLRVWRASSRVGERMRARAPEAREAFSRSKRGMRKAAVLPEPVLAIATTSRPSSSSGTVFLWIGVGTL